MDMFGSVPSGMTQTRYGYDPVKKQWGQGNSAGGVFKIAGPEASSTKTPSQVVTDILNNGTNAIPASLKGLSQMSTNTLTSTSGVSQPVQDASDQTARYVSNIIGQGTGTGGDASMNMINNMVQGGGAGTAAMSKALNPTDTSFLQSGADPVQTQKMTDVDMSQYMNPAQNAIYDAIIRGNDVTKNATRARMAKSRAFGANMDVAQGQNDDNMLRNLGLASADAYKLASANAAGDVSAENAGRQSNRNAVQTVNSQKLNTQLTDQQRALTGGAAMNDDARATGNQEWQQYLQKIGLGLNVGQSAASTLGALPGTKTLSQQQLGPSEAGQQIGALIGLTGLQSAYNKPLNSGSITSMTG